MNTQTCISDADLARLWEGEIPPRRREMFHQHLEACDHCKHRWEQMSAGARQVEALFTIAGEASSGECPPLSLMAGYLDDTLDPAEKRMVEEHLARCRRCRAQHVHVRRLSETYAAEGDKWWDKFVGQEVLRLILQAPEEIDNLLAAVAGDAPAAGRTQQVIQLPILQSSQGMAAATGEGFRQQTLHQDEPPFEFELVQFGQQLRITARALGQDPPCKDCLARLHLMEGETPRLSRVIIVEQGEGQCVLEPEEVQAARPQLGDLTVRLEPLVTSAQLSAAGSEAYMPILERLLEHDDPQIRQNTVRVLARVCGPAVCPIIAPLANDADETVRAAVQEILDQFHSH